MASLPLTLLLSLARCVLSLAINLPSLVIMVHVINVVYLSEVRLSELEEQLCTMETQSLATVVSQPPLAGVGAYTVLRNGVNSILSCLN